MLTKSDIKIIQSLLNDQEKRIKNNVVTFKDEILTEIVKLREDMVVTKGYGDTLEDHEQRISKLETAVKSP